MAELRTFRTRHQDDKSGHLHHGVQFPSGRVVVDADERLLTAAISIEALGDDWDIRWDDDCRKAVVEQFTAALLTGLDDLERDDHWGTLVRPGDVAQLVHKVAREVTG